MIGPEGLGLRKWKCAFACFQPDEVGRVAGLTAEIEEEWDSSGKMPWGKQTRQAVSAVPVVELSLHHELSSRGWEFEGSDAIVGKGIANVFFFALLAAEGACRVMGLPSSVDRFRADFLKDAELAASLTCEGERDRYMYRYGNEGPFRYGNGLQAIIDRSMGASLCLVDLQELAIRLCGRAGRSLLNIELKDAMPCSAERVTWLSQSRI